MKFDTWMPFFIGDYIADTSHLSTEQHGAYVLLLIHAWRNGGYISSDPSELAQVTKLQSKWKANASVLLRFFQESERTGFLTQKRLMSEYKKAKAISEKRSEFGKLGGRPKLNETKPKAEGLPNAKAEAKADEEANTKQNETPSQSHSQLAGEREPHEHTTPSADRPNEAEVLAFANRIGLAEWKARDWFNEMEGCGWLDYQHRPIVAWQPVLTRVKAKWEADGRPSAPPSNIPRGNSTASAGQPRIWDLTQQIKAAEAELATFKAANGHEDAFGWNPKDEAAKAQYRTLAANLRALKAKIKPQ